MRRSGCTAAERVRGGAEQDRYADDRCGHAPARMGIGPLAELEDLPAPLACGLPQGAVRVDGDRPAHGFEKREVALAVGVCGRSGEIDRLALGELTYCLGLRR